MKKELNNKYEIRLDFKRETENPSRLFRAFAEMIESVNSLDFLIAETVNTSVKSKIVLDDIEKGSIIGRFWSALTINEDSKIDNSPDKKEIEEYIEESRAESLKFISEQKSSVEDLDKLADNLKKIAEEKSLSDSFNYAEPDILKLAKTINKINDSTQELNQDESFELKSNSKTIKNIKSGTDKIDIDAVENALTENEIINETEMIYLIKKPDFLGDSAWSFKHGNKSASIKISHSSWLEEFHSGKIVVVPGDSLKVMVKQTSKYNTNGYLISDKKEIIEVIDVIHNN
ncbi:hypothetical protein [Tenacibaculum maritimum]|uniref:hypothetical protein n=1 Tax=Tenacibaculum maritimum TaxID=107401 RepID=UPI0010A55EC1|nr:hypothetical protein [Tenacibaculum maritimum]QCD61608.1 hypothetical protein B9C57_03170 [Tenacibaculum maritimum]